MGLQGNCAAASEGILTQGFVQIWTLRRGVLDKHEPLDMAGQLAAYSQALADAAHEVRIPTRQYGKR